MNTKIEGNVIKWNCCGREITYLANTSRIKEIKYRCNFCGKIGKSWNEMNEQEKKKNKDD